MKDNFLQQIIKERFLYLISEVPNLFNKLTYLKMERYFLQSGLETHKLLLVLKMEKFVHRCLLNKFIMTYIWHSLR